MPDVYLHSLFLRAELLVVLAALGMFVGDGATRYSGFSALLARYRGVALRLRTKLNREGRSIARRLWRGVIALGMLLVPVLILGWVLGHSTLLSALVLVAVFGVGFRSVSEFRLWRQAKAGNLPLELPGDAFMFADSHAVLRYLILSGAERFSSHVVGVSFWYLAGGMPLALGYVALAELVPVLAVPVFGWAAGSLFTLLHAVPKAITVVLLTLGACFVPRAKPLAVGKAKRFHGVVARLLGVSLGGRVMARDVPWEGDGPPKLLPEHFARWLLVRLAATVVLLLLLAAPMVVKMLNIITY